MGYRYHDYARRARRRQMALVVGVVVVIAGAFAGVRRFQPAPDTGELTGEVSLGTVASDPTTTAINTITTTTTSTISSATMPPTTALVAQAGPTSSPPVVAIFDTDTITLAGAVPNQAAADRLIALTQANSKTPAATINLLTIDPAVPADVAVRVVELNSVRFPEGEAIITIEHAAELQRMATFMTALPQVTVTVIGHSDDTGSDIDNLLLSQRRADAVVQFLVDQGIDRLRLTSAGAGETDLVTLDGDAAARALNRRTEFVVVNALVP
jgi:outer membrane protein OmpA-like peptidoglycan-associated protein